jgi:hypothetical protein
MNLPVEIENLEQVEGTNCLRNLIDQQKITVSQKSFCSPTKVVHSSPSSIYSIAEQTNNGTEKYSLKNNEQILNVASILSVSLEVAEMLMIGSSSSDDVVDAWCELVERNNTMGGVNMMDGCEKVHDFFVSEHQ